MAATVRYSATRAYGLFAPYTSIAASRPAICPGSSLRREMLSYIPFCAIPILSGRNSGFFSRSSNTRNTSSKSSFRHVQLTFVESIAGPGLGAADAPHFAVNLGQPRLVRGDRALAAANASDAVNGRQLVVFLKKNHHAIRKHDALRLRRMERRQLWNRYLSPGLGLRRKLHV